jgi:hypothetical protein
MFFVTGFSAFSTFASSLHIVHVVVHLLTWFFVVLMSVLLCIWIVFNNIFIMMCDLMLSLFVFAVILLSCAGFEELLFHFNFVCSWQC